MAPKTSNLQTIQRLILQVERDLVSYANLRVAAADAGITLQARRKELRGAKARMATPIKKRRSASSA